MRYILFILFIFFSNSIAFCNSKTIENIRISEDVIENTLRIVFDVTDKMQYSVFTLDNKPRFVIDIEASNLKIINKNKLFFIKEIRSRKTDDGIIRIVFDLNKTSYIKRHFYLEKNKKNLFRLVIDIKVQKKNALKYINKSKKDFIITLDAGHGGIDPGAINNKIREKDITLKSSKELKKLLEIYGYKVFLTRKSDTFISLRERRKLAKKFNSDLFISLHVDSVRKKSTRGTSVYTLSDKASDAVSARLAERENKADLIAGVNLETVDNEVASILLDLTRRDTKNTSSLFAENYVEYARKNGHRLLKRPHRHAGFAVLKSPDIPSVLIELGFLSNSKDIRLLNNKKTRIRLLKTLAKSIDAYVKDRTKKF